MRTCIVTVVLVCVAAAAVAKKPAPAVDPAARLIGAWSIDTNDKAGLAAYGRCSMEFKPNGQLVYSVPEGKMLLTYRIEGDVMITDQPSHPREERTHFSFAADGALVLDADGRRARFLRQASTDR